MWRPIPIGRGDGLKIRTVWVRVPGSLPQSNMKKLNINNITEKNIKRFWKKVDKESEKPCWIWTASRNRNGQGYGQFGINYKIYVAHRIAYILQHKEIPDDLYVCHSCDNIICVNPDHLRLGTHQDNMNDMKNKGRSPKSKSFGEQNGKAKLTKENVNEIKKLLKEGNLTQSIIGEKFNVSRENISAISRGKTWT